MILWSIKFLNTAKTAIAGRKYPHQLAWAVAFGLLLGIVPQGNLLAIALLLVVLSLKINHAMAGLTAIATTLLIAARLDPIAHTVGDTVLTDPRISPWAQSAWQWPFAAWTDLNNTVVMGSFLIGVTALVPVFVISYPIFRLFKPSDDRGDDTIGVIDTTQHHADARKTETSAHQIVIIDRGDDRIAAPHSKSPQSEERVEFESIESESTGDDPMTGGTENRIAVETRIDVIRMKGDRTVDSTNADNSGDAVGETKTTEEQPMDEALNYLLRQLRDSRQRSAA